MVSLATGLYWTPEAVMTSPPPARSAAESLVRNVTMARRNAFTKPKTRLSPIRSRTRPIRAVWSISSNE